MAEEKDRHEVLQRTGKMYKIQMNKLFKIVNSLKTESTTTITDNDQNIITKQSSISSVSPPPPSLTANGNNYIVLD